MLDLVDAIGTLQFGVLDNQLRCERVMQGDAHVLVDGGGEQEACVLLIVRWQVRTATAQRDSQRTARDNHPAILRSRRSSRSCPRTLPFPRALPWAGFLGPFRPQTRNLPQP